MKNNKISKIFVQISFFFILSQNPTANPLTHEKCSLQDSDCIKKQAQLALPTFIQGVPELGIQNFDKMHIDEIIVKSTDMFYELRNLEIGGFKDTIIDDLSINLPYKFIRLSFHTTLNVDCDYKLEGSLFGIRAIGDGKANISMKNIRVGMVLAFDIVKNEQDKDIMDIKTYLFGANAVDGVYSQLDNMFNGDKEKSEMFHTVINENWRPIVANFGRPFSAKIFQGVFEAIKTYMRSRPLEDLALY